ncbi:MAG: UDP-glucose 4-epimerase GalE [Verrucomicrobiales bacterium]|nr:UDP-glucose 4-epimerase GalE [Verrucomicrobiales bacterium]
MKVLVTGGAGYIGSVAVEALIGGGYEVVVVDNLYMGHRAAVHPSATFIEADLCEADRLGEIFQQHRPEAIMHFASYSLVGESMQDPAKYLGVNTTNALNLIDAGVKNGVERFILSSTANLFGSPESIPISETETLNPGSPYGESKFFIERILRWYQETHGLKYAALRYFNAAGCTDTRGEDHDPETHLIPLILQVALGQRNDIKIFGNDYNTPDGTCIRDYIHVSDLADAHILALEALSENSVLEFNLGNGSGFSVKEVIETVRKVTGHPIPAEIIDRRPGDPDALVADSSKIKKILGWNPKFPDLTDIISSAWDWHQKNPDGYSS